LVLERAGIAFRRDPADLDEDVLKARYRHTESADTVALALSEAKAGAVSKRHPGAWVIGADQMLVCDGRRFDKPKDKAEARAHLLALRGRSHDLISAVCAVQDGAVAWRHVERTTMTMIPFSDAFLEKYLQDAGSEVLDSVGAYRLEGPGARLFSEIDGDYFTILGLPLLPLLAFLREAGVIEV
jgi:septum formation protein